MIESKRIQSDVKPDSFQKLGNGTYYYNYDIVSEEVMVEDVDTKELVSETRYSFIQVYLQGQPDYKTCVKAIIRSYVDQDEEFDLINSSNRVTLKLSDENSDYDKYLEYLALLDTIKQNVKRDFDGKASNIKG